MLIKKISRIGTHKSDDNLQVFKTILTNLMAIFTIPVLLLYFVYFLYINEFGFSLFYGVTALTLFFVFYLNKRRRFVLSKTLVVCLGLILITTSTIAFGTETQSQIYLALLIICVFILFEKPYLKFGFSTFVFICYLLCFFQLEKNGPLAAHLRLNYDNYINFGFGLLSCAVLSNLIFNNINNYINQIKSNNKTLINMNKELADQKNIIQGQKEEMELFTSMASHDLKTPIRTINSFLDLIENNIENRETEKLKEYLSFAKGGSKQLEKLIQGISSYKKIDHDKPTFDYIQTNEIIKRVTQIVNPKNTDKINIESTTLNALKINEEQFVHLILNVFENAIKFNENEIKKIKITDDFKDGFYRINVCDNGIGIDSNYFDYVLKPFKKLHPTNIYKGSGMGLSICQKIMNLYSGKIEIESDRENGTCIIFSFPENLTKKD